MRLHHTQVTHTSKVPSSARATVVCHSSATRAVQRRNLLLSTAGSLVAVLSNQQAALAEEEVVTATATQVLAPPVVSGPEAAVVIPVAEPPKPSGPTQYRDEADKFNLLVPEGWVQAEGIATGARRTIAFFPTDVGASDVNISVVVTNVSVEFTKLGSFGDVSTFANNLINSQDRSFLLKRPIWARPPSDPIQIADLVDYKETRGQYFVEYTIQKIMPDGSEEPKRHLLSSLALGSNGRYNRLYTVTAQCKEEDLPKYKKVLKKSLDSFTAEVKPTA